MLLGLANPPGAYGSGEPALLNLVWDNFSCDETQAKGAAMTDDADRAAKALIAAFRLLADSLPGMHEKRVAPGVISLMSGLPVATLNGVFTDAARPDVTELDRAAARVAGLPLPWSIQFRGEPEPAAGRVAARYGLTDRTTSPLMVYHPAANQPAPPARASAAASVVVAYDGDRTEYAAALATGFEAPPEIMAPFSSPEAFALPGAVPYLAREDGQVVAVGFGVFGEGIAGVFNIATVPAYRGGGYGRAVTSRIVADGVARGADLAYLQSSEDGYPLYQSMGFRTVETWTYLSTEPSA
jgi:ribosomal protein S18 acetylase RimI-like enzyme